MSNDLLAAALEYAHLGWSVLPVHTIRDGQCSCSEGAGCEHPGKHPRTQHGIKDATTDEETIRAWWHKWPDANIGILTGRESGIIALDVDPRNGGTESLEGLEQQHGSLPETVESQTGGGGRHILLSHPGGVIKNENTGKLLGLGLDFKGDNGCIVAPPSTHISGNRYCWKAAHEPGSMAVAECPSWLLAKLTALVPAAPSTNGPNGDKDAISAGLRNSHLTSLAGSMRHRGMAPASILAALLAENEARCNPPMSKGEVEGIAKSVGHYAATDPTDFIILPSPTTPIIDSAASIFGRAGREKVLFQRDGKVYEILTRDGRLYLAKVDGDALRTRIETLGPTARWVSDSKGGINLKPSRPRGEDASGILNAPSVGLLPPISAVHESPILFDGPDGPTVLGKGYHQLGNDGFVIATGNVPDQPTLAIAADRLMGLLADFHFINDGDKARALAALITPGLRFGRFFAGHSPLFVLEADQPQTGKGYWAALVASVYDERPSLVAQRGGGGVGGLDESLSERLVAGRPFILLDNLRGKLDSQFLEAVLTAPGTIGCRVPYQRELHIRPDNYIFTATSNAMAATYDLAARMCVIRLRKQPNGYQYHKWSEGDLLLHVRRDPGPYLAAVHAVIMAWHQAGRPAADNGWHSFRQWAAVTGGIVKIAWPSLPALGEGHSAAAHRTATPALSWLRAVCLAVIESGRPGDDFTATGLVELSEAAGLDLPGIRPEADDAQKARRAGLLLAQCFNDGDRLEVEDVTVERLERQVTRETSGGGSYTARYYRFTASAVDRSHAADPPYEPQKCGVSVESTGPYCGCCEKESATGRHGSSRLDPDVHGPLDRLSESQEAAYHAARAAYTGPEESRSPAAWRTAVELAGART